MAEILHNLWLDIDSSKMQIFNFTSKPSCKASRINQGSLYFYLALISLLIFWINFMKFFNNKSHDLGKEQSNHPHNQKHHQKLHLSLRFFMKLSAPTKSNPCMLGQEIQNLVSPNTTGLRTIVNSKENFFQMNNFLQISSKILKSLVSNLAIP